ncbi:acetate--CoA ligase family protein [Pseudofrankia inefficax]|uniref:CoA-binding domain protein n=1 Tax=Pseudofrankia inefficax (strain DSM 45817 / CECT 9037 / DDB 130130 / EuI1c) TaxID=298654 RepID=E3IU41_PSEI1|nr:acetate--CoA ligase family protein [Pseudofrankia inefficax]ADP81234.1 CoA-binding domain protein [Pseudofrankia inefficax]
MTRPSLGAGTRSDLGALFQPRSVAIVGASSKGDGFGNGVVGNLLEGGYTGQVYPVHRSATTVDGLPTIRSFAERAGEIDCAVLAVPAGQVNQSLREAAAAGIRAALVLSSGFAEAGGEGLRMAQEMRDVAADLDLRIVGPNCLGAVSFVDRTVLTFLRGVGRMSAAMAASQGLAVVSQSGALGSNLLQAYRYGVPFSYFVGTGNSAMLDVGDFVGHLCLDERVTGICLLYEGLRENSPLLGALEAAQERGTPVVAVKAGRSAAGQRAASSHTASAVGDDLACVAALEARGVMVVEGPEQLIAAASFLARNRRPSPRVGGVSIVSGSGGIGVLLADSAERHGVPLATFTDETAERLKAVLPPYSTVENPVDLTAGSIGGNGVRDALRALTEDQNTAAAVIALNTTIHDEFGSERMTTVAQAAEASEVPLAAVLLAEGRSGPSLDILESSPHLGLFRSTDQCMRTIAHWMRLARPAGPTPEPDRSVDWDRVALLLAGAPRGADGLLDEPTSQAVLAAVGVEGPRQIVVDTPEAVRTRGWAHYPAVAKVVSADLQHKARYGGVVVGVLDEEALVAACSTIEANVSGQSFPVRISGYLVQEMALGTQELLLGALRDPVYGPIVVIGQGGGGAGRRSSARATAAPLTRARAAELVAGAPATAALPDGVQSSVAHLAVRLGELMTRFPRVAELEVNPLLVTHDRRVVGVDAVVRVTS